jgi:hypothetical protein
MKDILRFKSKVISTIKIAAEDKLPSSVYKEKISNFRDKIKIIKTIALRDKSTTK